MSSLIFGNALITSLNLYYMFASQNRFEFKNIYYTRKQQTQLNLTNNDSYENC